MARYRKIDPRIWNDEKFASLSHEGQRAFLFILTHPSMTSLGAFRATKEGIEAELGIDTKGFAKPFQELLSKGLIKYDESCFLVFAPNFLKYNQPENPNVVKGWAGCLDLLPECPLLAEVLQRAKSCASANSKTSKAFSESLGRVTETLSERYAKQLSKGLAIQEQEQEQEYKDVSDETSSSANANVRECESAEDNQTDLFEKGVAAATVGRTPAPKNGQTESKPLSGLEHHPAPKVAPNPADVQPESASNSLQTMESNPADELSRKPAKRKTAKSLADSLQKPEGVGDDLWRDWVAHKKKVSKDCTQRMVNAIVREAAAAGITTAQAMEMQLEHGWVGFEARYLTGKQSLAGPGRTPDAKNHFGNTKVAAHLKNEAMRFTDDYYADANRPDGTPDWGC